MTEFFRQKNKGKSDEYYTPEYAVEIILPYLHKYKKIWCPFDKEESNFVKMLKKEGYDVVYGHIETGQDFFDYEKVPNGVECIVSNPPFSKRDQIFERLYQFNIPFAMIMNFNGLFDSKSRFETFRDANFELLIPKGRIKFITNEGVQRSPSFQSVYVCNGLLPKQMVFVDMDIK